MDFEENIVGTPNVQDGGIEGRNTQGKEKGSERVEYMCTLHEHITNLLLSNGSS